MRIGHASIDERGKISGGSQGDNNKKEVCVREYYDKNWKMVLRCKDAAKAEAAAKACESLCANDNVGYNQARRLELNKELSKLGYDYKRLNTKCSCDCSSFMAVCYQCAGVGVSYANGNAPTTSNMKRMFLLTGLFDCIESNISKSILRRGDILVNPGSHTVMVLDDGTEPLQKRRVLKKGMRGEDVKWLQLILLDQGYNVGTVDSVFGPKVDACVRQFQIDKGLVSDGCVGIKTYAMLEQYS